MEDRLEISLDIDMKTQEEEVWGKNIDNNENLMQ